MMKRWLYPVLFALTVSGYPLFSSIPLLLDLPSRTVAGPFRAFVALVSIATLVLYAASGRSYGGATWFAVATFWTLYIVRLASDTVFAPITLGMPRGDYWIQAFVYCLLPMIGLFAIPDRPTLARAARLTLWTTAIACPLALMVTYRRFLLGDPAIFELGGRLGNETLNPITFGNLGLTLVIMCVLYMDRKKPTRTLLLVGLSAVGIATLALTGSRGPVLALAVISLAALLKEARRVSHARLVATIVAGVVGIAVLIGVATTVEERFGFALISRFQSLQDVRAEESGRAHAELLTHAWSQFAAHPISGSALEEITLHYYPHNVILESLMATGIFGGTLFCLLLGSTVFYATRLIFRSDLGWIGYLCYQQVIWAVFAGVLYQSGGMWAMIAATAAIAYGNARTGQAGVTARDIIPAN